MLRSKTLPMPVTNKAPSATSQTLKPNTNKRFHWQPVGNLEDTLWNEMDSDMDLSTFDLNVSEVHQTFVEEQLQKKAAAPTAATDKNAAPVNKKISLIDSKRSYNVDIAIARFRLPLPQLFNYIHSLDASFLTDDTVETLLLCVPTAEEVEVCTAYTGKVEELDTVSQWFLMLTKLPHISTRIRLLHFILSYQAQFYHIEQWLNVVEQACKDLRTCRGLRVIMGLTLKLGNLLNGSQSAVQGFKVSSLLRLKFMRSADKSVTLLQYLIQFLRKSNTGQATETLQLAEQLKFVVQASKIEVSAIRQAITAMKTDVKLLETELKQTKLNHQWPAFAQHCQPFYNEHAQSFLTLQQRLDAVLRVCIELGKYFGESELCQQSWEPLFAALK